MMIDKDLLSNVCAFLKPFEQVLQQFSSDIKPTIYEVLPFRQYLLNQCKVHPDDHDGIQQIKTFLEKRIQDVWILHDVHYITTLLHPLFKHFHVNPVLRDKAIDLVKNEISKRQSSSSSINSTSIMKLPVQTDGLGSQSSTSKSLLSQCFDIPKNDLTLSPTPYDELEQYMSLNVQLSEDEDVLLFWLQYKSKYPILFSIVQDLYAIPSSNTTVERLFSSSKNTITDKRSSLGAEKVNRLLFLQKNLKLLKEIDEMATKEATSTETKSTIIAQPFGPVSHNDQEQLLTATVPKKFKTGQSDDIIICDDGIEEDKENDQIDLL